MAGELNVNTVITSDILPSLHATSSANLTYWTKANLLEWADDGLKRLSRVAAVWVERDTSNTTVSGTATYALPARHNATLHVSFGTAPLRPANTIELEMRDPDYATVAATSDDPPAYWYEDLQGTSTIGVTPVPASAVSLPIVCSVFPTEVDTAELNTLVQAPAPLAGYLAMYTLQKAYAREGEAEQSDCAMHLAARCQMYEEIFKSYFGPAI